MEPKDFMINVGPNGTFRPSGIFQTVPEDIDAIFQRFENEQIKNITIYFHGGLVNEKKGMENASKMGANISAIGHTPLCFVWETGLIETLATNIGKISDTKIFNKLIKLLVKKLSEKLGFDTIEGRGTGNSLTDQQIEAELFKPVPFESYTQNKLETNGRSGNGIMTRLPQNEKILQASLEAEFTIMVQSDSEFQKAIAQTQLTVNSGQNSQSRGIISTAAFIKHLANIALNVIKRFINKRDHDFFPTIIEEILREIYIAELGAWVWNNMKIKSNDMWSSNQGISGLNQFAGRYLLDKLNEYFQKHNDVEINLIGHSAGSIAICNLLKVSATVNPQLKYNTIIFLAPACRIDLFNKEIVQNTGRFKKFRMFTMNDNFETNDILVRFLYTHSLLYLISGVLEGEGKDPDSFILGLERHINGKSPYDVAPELIATGTFLNESSKSRVILSQTISSALDGLRTMSEKHGDFDEEPETVKSIQHFLKEA